MTAMRCNVGGWDRTLRLASGLAALSYGLFGPVKRSTSRTIAISVGAVELLTGLSRYCPLNQALGVNTCEADIRVGRQMEELV